MHDQDNFQKASPPNYLLFAIWATIFCGKMIGTVAISFGSQVNSVWDAGDYEGATKASKNAKLWRWILFAVGLSTITIGLLLSTFGIIAGLSFGGFEF